MAHLNNRFLPTHPLTGIRAVYIDRHGRPRFPIMGGDDSGDGGDDDASGDGSASSTASEPGFPANTPLEQMTAEQREAYWKHYARRNEDRVKAFGKLTPEELTTLREKASQVDALTAASRSDMEKAVDEARQTTQREADAKYLPLLAETAFRVAIGDRRPQNEVDDFIADLNLSRFLTDDGQVDTAKVLSRVEQFAPATGNRRSPAGPTVFGLGAPTPQRPAPGEQGRAMAAKRFGAKQ